jgi:hypothetical protein
VGVKYDYMWDHFFPVAFLQWVEVPLVVLLAVSIGTAAGVLARRVPQALAWAYSVFLPVYLMVKEAPWIIFFAAGAGGQEPWPVDDLTSCLVRMGVVWLLYVSIAAGALVWAHYRLRLDANRV